MIDFVIVGQRGLQDVRITRAMRGAECWTDHRLVRAIFNLHIALQYSKKSKAAKASFNTAKLTHHRCLHHLHDALEENPHEGSSTEKWSQLKDTVTNTVKAVLGPHPGHTRTGSTRIMNPSRQHWVPRTKHMLSGRESHHLRQRSADRTQESARPLVAEEC